MVRTRKGGAPDAEAHPAPGDGTGSPVNAVNAGTAVDAVVDAAVEGLPAVVSIRIPGGKRAGEVRLFVRGTYEHLIAYSLEPLEIGRQVEVLASLGHRSAEVRPTTRGT